MISDDWGNDIEDSEMSKRTYELTHFVPCSQIKFMASACIGNCILVLVKKKLSWYTSSSLWLSVSASGFREQASYGYEANDPEKGHKQLFDIVMRFPGAIII